MSGEHGEPWVYILDEIFDASGDSIGVIPEPGDAERILACVNALDGVSTADIEAGVVRRLIFAGESDVTLGYRMSLALAACEGMDTSQLTPGCVAKLVEALHRIACMSDEPQAAKEATAALAAMKGV